MYTLSLNGQWYLGCLDSEQEDKDYLPVTIPGSVLSGLLENEAIPDPFYRTNEYSIRELFRKDFEFCKSFSVSGSDLLNKCVDLVCYGLDTITEIYINDHIIATTDNMHRTWRFDIKEFLTDGDNYIRIVTKAPITYMENHVSEEGKEIHYIPCGGMKGNQYIRKAHCMFGWDWGAQLPDAGIWRDIQLEFYNDARIMDVYFNQEHMRCDDKTDVRLNIKTDIGIYTPGTYRVCVNIIDPDGQYRLPLYEMKTYKEERADSISLSYIIDNARLWWPNNLGEQPLYNVSVSISKITDSELFLECQRYKIGLRTFEVSKQKDEWGNEFAFMVNGVKFFAMGADYIPEDTIYSRITRERIEKLIKASVWANYNTLRVWGGGYYPGDDFYDLCDQYGIIVWQDLMYACNVYELTDDFKETIAAETADNVRRLRHHACLGLWCGNNEIESAWSHWYGFCDHSASLKADYIKMFEVMLPEIVSENDPEHLYWPSSPSSGGWFDNPDDDNRGDKHYWDVWHGEKPFTEYRKYYFRFCSEFGFQSFPSIKTIATFAEPEDMNIFSRVMESHQKNGYANAKILHYISQNFRYPKDFESVIYVSQILQAMAVKYGVEHWRRNRGRCMGSIYWQINDSWPVASWSSVDYYGRYKALMYFSKNFYAPVAISAYEDDGRVSVWVENETFKAEEVSVTVALRDLSFRELYKKQILKNSQPFSGECIYEEDFSAIISGRKEVVYLEVTGVYPDGRIQSEVVTFVPYKHLNLKRPQIKCDCFNQGTSFLLELTSDTFAPFVMLDFEGFDAVFSDNYFHIASDKPVRITLDKKDLEQSLTATDIKNRITIKTVRDSYD